MVCAAVLIGGAVVLVLLLRSPSESASDGVVEEVRIPVRVVDEEHTFDLDLAVFPTVRGRVAYEGPSQGDGEENWKASHVYEGVELRAVMDQAADLDGVESVSAVALDGWHKTLSAAVLDGDTACGTAILALSVDGEASEGWEDAPMLVFLPEDERFSNQDMLDALGSDRAHYFGTLPSTTGLMVKGIRFLVLDYDGGSLPTLDDL